MIELDELMRTRNMGFIKELGMKHVFLEPGHAILELELTPEHANPIGSVHGGVIFSLADSTGGAAAASRGKWPTTLCSTINYLSPAMGSKKLIGESREIKTGKTTCVYGVLITDDRGRNIADITLTYYYLADIETTDALADIAKAHAKKN